jgi:hypothetical protein
MHSVRQFSSLLKELLMDTLRGPSLNGLQHMASRAKDMRSALLPATDPALVQTGKKTTEIGNSLPQSTSTEQSTHATGIERAIESLQKNVEKNPQAKGLQQALEKLQARLSESTSVDTTA